MPLNSRTKALADRYGWRAPFIIIALAWQRSLRLRERIALHRLKLFTRGEKGHNIRIGCDLKFTPGSFLILGSDLYIGDRCTFEIDVCPEAYVVIGSDSW